MRLSTSEVESEDEDVTYERGRVLSGDVSDDVLVLQDLTKVSLFATFFFSSCDLLCCLVSFLSHIHIKFQLAKLVIMGKIFYLTTLSRKVLFQQFPEVYFWRTWPNLE